MTIASYIWGLFCVCLLVGKVWRPIVNEVFATKED